MALAIIMMAGFPRNIYAADVSEEICEIEEVYELEPAESVSSGQDDAAVTAGCTHPQWTWECRKNFIGTENNVTHKYGLFWSKTCTTTVKLSTVRNFCYICKANLPQFDTSEQHECRQIHKDCGKGTEDICMIIGQYSIKGAIQ